MKPIYDLLGVTVGIIQSGQYDDRQAGGVRARRHLRHQLRVRLRLPARQHRRSRSSTVQRGHGFAIVDEVDNILIDEARTPLIISGQPEQAADPTTSSRSSPRRWSRARSPRALEAKRRSYEADFDSSPTRSTRRSSVTERGVAKAEQLPRHRQPLPRRARQPGQPPPAGAEGRVPLQARRRLRRDRRRGQDHRRVHRPHPRGPALVGGAAPGRRGQGGRGDPGGEPDGRHDHLPELLPPLRQARRHDRHGAHRGHRVHEDLRATGGGDPDQPADGPRGQATTRSTRPRKASGRAVASEIAGAPRRRASRCSSARSRSRSRSSSPSS